LTTSASTPKPKTTPFQYFHIFLIILFKNNENIEILKKKRKKEEEGGGHPMAKIKIKNKKLMGFGP
jgi:hypothetical protein